ncbi:MAG: N-acetylneuraminate synthase family protein [Candidatus Nanopelagicales bacterium]
MSIKPVKIGNRLVGLGQSCYIIAEIGINHNGDIDIAKKLIEMSAKAGCDAVKFQKRTPELCVPMDQRNIIRETPWGQMTYMDYRYKVEFDESQYEELANFANKLNVHLFASPWDTESVDFLVKMKHPVIKIPSASITDFELLEKIASTNLPVIMSTGMSTMEQIEKAVAVFNKENLLLAHSTSAYPCDPKELNLRMIPVLQEKFQVPIGNSGHETGIQTTVAAVTLGACFVERHVTLDRAMWGSDQSASVEPPGVQKLVRDIRVVESALGDGVKKVYESELKPMSRLRKNI